MGLGDWAKKKVEVHEAGEYGKEFANADFSGVPMLAKLKVWFLTHKQAIGLGFGAVSVWVAAGCKTVEVYGQVIDPVHLVNNLFKMNFQCSWLVFPIALVGAWLHGAGAWNSDEREKYVQRVVATPPSPGAPAAPPAPVEPPKAS